MSEYKAEAELAELRRALHREQTARAREKKGREELVEAVYSASKDAALLMGPGVVIAPQKDTRRKSEEVALVHTTDWQLGKLTAGYSIETCQERIRTLASKVLTLTDIQRADHPVKRCHVFLGGDMVEGLGIFPGQAYEVQAHLFGQLFATASLIDELIRTLAANFEHVHVTAEYGNHGRLGRKGEMPSGDNVDRMAYEIAKDRASNLKNVTWQMSANWYQIVEIGRYRALLVHGDEIKSFGGNTPAFGILRKCNAWATGVVPPFQDVYMGHFHTPMSLTLANGGRVFVTGSPESENVYAAEFVAAKGKPSQRLHFIDPVKARTTAEYTVWLD